jgi:hypothetical protein
MDAWTRWYGGHCQCVADADSTLVPVETCDGTGQGAHGGVEELNLPAT